MSRRWISETTTNTYSTLSPARHAWLQDTRKEKLRGLYSKEFVFLIFSQCWGLHASTTVYMYIGEPKTSPRGWEEGNYHVKRGGMLIFSFKRTNYHGYWYWGRNANDFTHGVFFIVSRKEIRTWYRTELLVYIDFRNFLTEESIIFLMKSSLSPLKSLIICLIPYGIFLGWSWNKAFGTSL